MNRSAIARPAKRTRKGRPAIEYECSTTRFAAARSNAISSPSSQPRLCSESACSELGLDMGPATLVDLVNRVEQHKVLHVRVLLDHGSGEDLAVRAQLEARGG